MDGSWPNWAQPARARVLLVLVESRAPLAARELARLAHVSPTTASRIAKDLVRTKEAARIRERASRTVRYVLVPGALRAVRRTRPRRDTAAQLEYLSDLSGPIWVISPAELFHLGVVRRVPTFVAMPRSWRHRVEVPVPVVLFERARPLERVRPLDRPDPGLDRLELLIALLKMDAVAARQMYEVAPPSGSQRRRLLRRIHQERLESAARAARIPLDTRPWMQGSRR